MPTSSSSDEPVPQRPCLRSLFEEEESGLVRYAFGLLGRLEVAEEVVQDAFLQLHKHWENVEKPVPWLYRSVRNRAYNHHRDHKREVLAGESREGEGLESVGREAPDEWLRRLEAAGHVRMLLEELPPEDRELVRLKYEENLKYREISERLGLSIGNVGYRLHHVLKLLAGKLHQLGIDSAS